MVIRIHKRTLPILLVAILVLCAMPYVPDNAATETSSSSGAIDWGLSFQNPGATPVTNVSKEYLRKFDGYFVGNEEEKVLYLTFDAGYENGNTPRILDALKKHNAPAAFFLVGNFLEREPELVCRMAKEGHIVANHTFSHPDMSSISDFEKFEHEVSSLAEKYREVTGEEMKKYYRPPQGKFSEENLRSAQKLGYRTVFWSLAYVDWQNDKQPSHDSALKTLTERVHPGAVVLLHSTSQTNGEILDELLTKWESMGYTFASLDELCKE